MSFKKSIGILVVSALAIAFILTGNIACSKKAGDGAAAPVVKGEQAAPVSQEMGIKEGVNDITGTVKSALGKYFYIVQMPGFDITLSGNFDAAMLVGKDVKVKAEFHRDRPSLLVAQSIEAKEGTAPFAIVYTASETGYPQDFFDQKMRTEFAELKITAITKAADWEGKGKVKIPGRFIPASEKQVAAIAILDDKDKETARVIVDNMTEYTNYYLKKLRLFDKFWFYLTIKESVPANQRAKAKEIFHADIVFAGLY